MKCCGNGRRDRKSTRLNSSHVEISYAVFCLKKKKGPMEAVPGAPRVAESGALPCGARCDVVAVLFFFNETATTEIYTLSLHDALPISPVSLCCRRQNLRRRANLKRRHPKRADRKSTRLNSSHVEISYAVFCLKKK